MKLILVKQNMDGNCLIHSSKVCQIYQLVDQDIQSYGNYFLHVVMQWTQAMVISVTTHFFFLYKTFHKY